MPNYSCDKKQKILIVDDNPAIHEDYLKILQFSAKHSQLDELSSLVFGEEEEQGPTLPGFEIESAFQGQEALEMVTEALENGQPYSMAFVDMRMPPGWDGLQTIEHLWQVDPKLQVVICTAYSDYSWAEIVDRIAHRDRLLILKKPFDNVEVCQLAIALTHKWELERQAENRMDAIVETAADAILTTRADGIIENGNKAARELFGYAENELIEKQLCELLVRTNDDQAEDSPQNASSEPSLSPGKAFETEAIRKDGSTLPVLLSVSSFKACDGIRQTAIIRDLTEFKTIQAQLFQSRKLESVGQLAAGVAHEINTPMQFIDMNISFLHGCAEKLNCMLDAFEENLVTTRPAKSWESRWTEMQDLMEKHGYQKMREEIPGALQDCVDGVQRVVGIVRAMKEMTHPGSEAIVRLDLNHAIQSAVTVTCNHWKSVAEMHLELDESLPELCCIPNSVQQVLVNLIVNAADAIAEKNQESPSVIGEITIRTRNEADFALIEIEDSGCGIPAELRERIFDPFFTTKSVGKGTGQGLAIVYDAVVNKHKGELEFAGNAASGTTFLVRLPWGAESCPVSTDTSEADLPEAMPSSA